MFSLTENWKDNIGIKNNVSGFAMTLQNFCSQDVSRNPEFEKHSVLCECDPDLDMLMYHNTLFYFFFLSL